MELTTISVDSINNKINKYLILEFFLKPKKKILKPAIKKVSNNNHDLLGSKKLIHLNKNIHLKLVNKTNLNTFVSMLIFVH